MVALGNGETSERQRLEGGSEDTGCFPLKEIVVVGHLLAPVCSQL